MRSHARIMAAGSPTGACTRHKLSVPASGLKKTCTVKEREDILGVTWEEHNGNTSLFAHPQASVPKMLP